MHDDVASFAPGIHEAVGLHDLGDGCFAYLQPDGSWGWSNAGLIVGDGCSLLVDTLFDLRLTGEMLAAMASPTRVAPIATVVGLAFKLSDPDRLLGGDRTEYGITCALIPRDTPEPPRPVAQP